MANTTKEELKSLFKKSIATATGADKKAVQDTAVDQFFNGTTVTNKYSLFTVSGSFTSSVEYATFPANSVVTNMIVVVKEPIYLMTGSMDVEFNIAREMPDYENIGDLDGFAATCQVGSAVGDQPSGSDGPEGSGTVTICGPGTGSMTNFLAANNFETEETANHFAPMGSTLSPNYNGEVGYPYGYFTSSITIPMSLNLEDSEATTGDLPQSQSFINNTGQVDVYITYQNLF